MKWYEDQNNVKELIDYLYNDGKIMSYKEMAEIIDRPWKYEHLWVKYGEEVKE